MLNRGWQADIKWQRKETIGTHKVYDMAVLIEGSWRVEAIEFAHLPHATVDVYWIGCDCCRPSLARFSEVLIRPTTVQKIENAMRSLLKRAQDSEGKPEPSTAEKYHHKYHSRHFPCKSV